MMKQIAEVLEGARQPRARKDRRDRQPVRRRSQLRGRCERAFWRRTSHQEVKRVVLSAELYEKVERERGRRSGPLGYVALEVLRYLANLVSHETGRLEPSYDTLMARLKRSRDAIARALNALEEHGFLERLRRCEETGHEGRGPQVRQTSNAYRLRLPERAAKLLGRMGKAPPLPDDVVQMQAERAAEREAHRAALGLDELPRFEVDDDPLAEALAQLGRLVQERESAKQSEFLSERLT